MAGQIINRGERTWLVRVYMGRDPETGKRRYHNKTIHGSKKDAQSYLHKVLREKDMGIVAEPANKTLNQYLDQWLETVAKPRVKERTYYDYESLLRRYVRPELGGHRLTKLTPVEIQNLYNKMQNGGLAPRTIRYTHAVLRSALKQAVKWRLLSQNPADLVDLPQQKREEMQALSPAEVDRFLSAAKEDRYYVLFLLAVTTGMRPSEYLALQWKDINFENGNLSVRRTLIRRGRSDWYFEEPKTARSRRSIKLPPTVIKALREYKIRQAEEHLAAGPDYENHDLVFATRHGNPLHLRNLVRRHYKPILKRAGLPESLRLYDLRHTCATLLLAAGENPKIVSERLGHASVTLTLDTYSHVLPDMQQGAVDKLEAMLFSG